VETRRIGPVDIAVTSRSAAIAAIQMAINAGEPRVFGFANAHSVNLARHDAGFADVLRNITLFNDGIGVDLGSKLLYGAPFPENLNGTDLTPAVLSVLPAGTRVYLLGGKPGVAAAARDAILQFAKVEIVGTQDGYFTDAQSAAVADQIRDARAQLVLVAMGQPRQEQWAVREAKRHNAVAMCIGAYLDFVSGRVPRAPRLVRDLRVEWMYRLAIEPRRMANRYLIGNLTFMLAALRQRLGSRS
jgi:exopolysaccharide biosynthesis WecB/TagA/CpsF family protein